MLLGEDCSRWSLLLQQDKPRGDGDSFAIPPDAALLSQKQYDELRKCKGPREGRMQIFECLKHLCSCTKHCTGQVLMDYQERLLLAVFRWRWSPVFATNTTVRMKVIIPDARGSEIGPWQYLQD